jgi:outer membrane receptor for Fe3+-dicitrate
MNCVIPVLEINWYLSFPWCQKIPNPKANLLEQVYLKITKTFGYCCGIDWHDNIWSYPITCNQEIFWATKYQINYRFRISTTHQFENTYICAWRSRNWECQSCCWTDTHKRVHHPALFGTQNLRSP